MILLSKKYTVDYLTSYFFRTAVCCTSIHQCHSPTSSVKTLHGIDTNENNDAVPAAASPCIRSTHIAASTSKNDVGITGGVVATPEVAE